jgi:hypothetical protein|nr:MAG TPA: hypothetical protein [Caudoviricetes sp.]
MAEFNIGKVIPQFKGRYTTKEIYEELDVVAHNGCTWVSQSNNNQTEPSEDNTKWKLVMQSPISQADVNNLNNIFLPMITDKLEEISKKIQENTADIKEQHGLVLDNLNTTAYTRTKLNEFSQRLSKIEKKLGI